MNVNRIIPQYWKTVVYTGADNIKDILDRRICISVNVISLVTVILCYTIAPLLYFVNGQKLILFPALIEGCIFTGIIALNYYGRYQTAIVAFYAMQNVAVVYFGILFGMNVPVNLMFAFLIALCFLVFKENSRLRPLGIVISCLGLLCYELGNYYHIIQPIAMDTQKLIITKWIAYPVIGTLLILAYKAYDTNFQYVNREREHSHQRELTYYHQQERANTSKSIFVREISHEIATPLSAIYAIADIFLRKVEAGSLKPIATDVKNLYSASSQVLRITGNVLHFSKIEAGKQLQVKLVDTDIAKEVSDIVAVCRYYASTYHVGVQLHVDRDFPALLQCDKIMLTQICNNLLSNAIKFSPRQSDVIVTLSAQKDSYLLSVEDKGKGIHPDKLEQVFELFNSDRTGKAGGTGIGLPITRHLVTLLGGSVSVDSKVGRGTRFTISMPLIDATGDTKTDDNEEINNSTDYLKGKKALVVDDSPINLIYCARPLTAVYEMQVLAAGNVEEAQALIDSNVFDIIFLDINVPTKSDCIEIIRRIKASEQPGDVPIIGITGNAFNVDLDDDRIDDLTDYLSKPFKELELKALLIKYLIAGNSIVIQQR